jgi:hypothetical protein
MHEQRPLALPRHPNRIPRRMQLTKTMALLLVVSTTPISKQCLLFAEFVRSSARQDTIRITFNSNLSESAGKLLINNVPFSCSRVFFVLQ